MSASDNNGQRDDFPVLCETCLGENPYLRMMKAAMDKECKICARPMDVWRWKPGPKARFKKTEVCKTCAKVKNVCQTCLLDLQFSLPVQVRDTLMNAQASVPKSGVNREYFAENSERQLAAGDVSAYGKAAPNMELLRMARTEPYYKRNRAHICSFFVKGECNRGDMCPYRHEMPQTGELSYQNMKDRYYGVNDPVAKKILGRNQDADKKLKAPEDKSITTLYVGGIGAEITEADIRDQFYSFGEIRDVRMVHNKNCCFVSYTTREAAEEAASKLVGRLFVKGHNLRLMWGRPRAGGANQQQHSAQHTKNPMYPQGYLTPQALPQSQAVQFQNTQQYQQYGQQQQAPGLIPPPPVNPPPGHRKGSSSQPYYPSMDPQAMGQHPE
eukprot:GFYU01017271.1.p1 GENE.GFYU01017271.1~~GFYU01017271.1.p1  ORF type:complete len:384 (+),score=78.57 GFYU01017271.1:175-1326(+)